MTVQNEIEGMLSQFSVALNNRDAREIGKLWAEEGSFVDQWGRFAFGRSEVEQFFDREFSGPFANARFKALRLEIRPLSEETAVGECDGLYENVAAPNGRFYNYPHRIDAVFVRREGSWRFLSAHPSPRSAT